MKTHVKIQVIFFIFHSLFMYFPMLEFDYSTER